MQKVAYIKYIFDEIGQFHISIIPSPLKRHHIGYNPYICVFIFIYHSLVKVNSKEDSKIQAFILLKPTSDKGALRGISNMFASPKRNSYWSLKCPAKLMSILQDCFHNSKI